MVSSVSLGFLGLDIKKEKAEGESKKGGAAKDRSAAANAPPAVEQKWRKNLDKACAIVNTGWLVECGVQDTFVDVYYYTRGFWTVGQIAKV